MIVYIDRYKFCQDATLGMVQVEDEQTGLYDRICFTLELPWAENHPALSCIPEGKYDCIRHDSPDHPNTWEVTDVPNRSEILIHNGNTAKDTKGCILVGDSFGIIDGENAVLNSVMMLNKLRQVWPDNFALQVSSQPGEELTNLTI